MEEFKTTEEVIEHKRKLVNRFLKECYNSPGESFSYSPVPKAWGGLNLGFLDQSDDNKNYGINFFGNVEEDEDGNPVRNDVDHSLAGWIGAGQMANRQILNGNAYLSGINYNEIERLHNEGQINDEQYEYLKGMDLKEHSWVNPNDILKFKESYPLNDGENINIDSLFTFPTDKKSIKRDMRKQNGFWGNNLEGIIDAGMKLRSPGTYKQGERGNDFTMYMPNLGDPWENPNYPTAMEQFNRLQEKRQLSNKYNV